MKIKKLVALGLCSSLAMAMTVPAFAATAPANSTTITTTYKEIPISVVVPKTATAMINPYGMPYEIKDDADKTIATISGQQITTNPAAIINHSAVDLDVNAIVTTKVTSASADDKLTLVESAVEAAETEKKANIYLELGATELKEADIDVDSGEINATKLAKAAEAWTEASEKKIVLTETGEATLESGALITLTKATSEKAVAGGIALFRLSGTVTKNPKNHVWNNKDGVVATVAFKFSPAAAEEEP